MTVETIVLKIKDLQFDAIAAGPPEGLLVLCLHGFPQFADAWQDILEDLARGGFRAVAVDQRGYSPGARPAKIEDYSLENLTRDCLGFADALKAERFHLLGHDWGGIIAWNVASGFPGRLLSLTVLSTPHPKALAHAIRNNPEQRRMSVYVSLFRLPFRLAELVLKMQNWKRLRLAYRGRVRAEQVDRNIARFSEKNALTSALNWYRAFDFSKIQTAQIKVRTLYIWGAQDPTLGGQAARDTEKYVGGSYRFEEIQTGTHWLLNENPAAMSRIILQHLQSE